LLCKNYQFPIQQKREVVLSAGHPRFAQGVDDYFGVLLGVGGAVERVVKP